MNAKGYIGAQCSSIEPNNAVGSLDNGVTI